MTNKLYIPSPSNEQRLYDLVEASIRVIKLNSFTMDDVLNVLYDRYLCKVLGIDYCNIKDSDYFKVAKYLGERDEII